MCQGTDRTYTMIVVDDEPAARKYALQQIEWDRLGITRLYEAENGLDALRIMEEQQPDIMILDIRMPGMDGVALLEELCRRKYEISVIGLSGYSDFEAARRMLSSGKVVEYLLKPASGDALFEAVTRCLEQIENREQLERLRRKKSSGGSELIGSSELTGGSESVSSFEPDSGSRSEKDMDFESPTLPDLPPEISGHKSAIVRLAKEYIQKHYGEKLSLDEVAAQVYINPSYLSRIFTEVEGTGFNKYLQRVRIDKAKELLKDPRYKVYEVADQVGYPNFHHFLKLFKKLEQTTPSKYRENELWLTDL